MLAISRFVLRHKGVVVFWLAVLVATARGARVLLDATIVRPLLALTLIALFGERYWWLPRPARRLLRGPGPAARPASFPDYCRHPAIASSRRYAC